MDGFINVRGLIAHMRIIQRNCPSANSLQGLIIIPAHFPAASNQCLIITPAHLAMTSMQSLINTPAYLSEAFSD